MSASSKNAAEILILIDNVRFKLIAVNVLNQAIIVLLTDHDSDDTY